MRSQRWAGVSHAIQTSTSFAQVLCLQRAQTVVLNQLSGVAKVQLLSLEQFLDRFARDKAGSPADEQDGNDDDAEGLSGGAALAGKMTCIVQMQDDGHIVREALANAIKEVGWCWKELQSWGHDTGIVRNKRPVWELDPISHSVLLDPEGGPWAQVAVRASCHVGDIFSLRYTRPTSRVSYFVGLVFANSKERCQPFVGRVRFFVRLPSVEYNNGVTEALELAIVELFRAQYVSDDPCSFKHRLWKLDIASARQGAAHWPHWRHYALPVQRIERKLILAAPNRAVDGVVYFMPYEGRTER